MHNVYHLESIITDKIGRTKQTKHIGIYKTIDDLEASKKLILEQVPTTTFKVYIIEHLFS